MAGTLTISGMSASEPAGQRQIGPITIPGTQVVGETLAGPLLAGDNTFAIPGAATACLVIPPALGTVVLTLRTSANIGDGGLPLNPTLPLLYCFPQPVPTSLVVNASAGQGAIFSIVFI